MTTTTPAATIYLEVDGKPEPLGNLVWTGWAPCGCRSSSAYAEQGYGHNLLTEEDARASMRESKIQIQREIDDGFTYQLMTFAQMQALGGWPDCPHTPKWGVLRVEVPDGHVWATPDRWYAGRRTFKRHIVRTEDADERATSKAPAFCGYSPGRSGGTWSTDDKNLRPTVTCRKCEEAVQS